MVKNKLMLIALALCTTGCAIETKAYFEQFKLDDIKSVKKLDMDFDNNTALNKVNNKIYSPSQNTAKYVSSLKGNAFEGNNSKINIPFADLGISESNKVITVSFIFKWEGDDNNFFPISIYGNGSNNIWFRNGYIGFNTGNSDVYGVSGAIEKNKYYSIVAEFNLGDVSKNKLYINGVKQNLSYVYGTSSKNNTWNANSSFTIGGYSLSETYNIKDKSIIDEVKLFTKSLTQQEVNDVTNSHKIPQLQVEVVNNTYTKLDWATEILPENILWKSGYDVELGDKQPKLNYGPNSSEGGQSFFTDEKYSGSTSIKVQDTYTNGNFYNAPATEALDEDSVNIFEGIVGLKNEVPLSITYRAKSNNDSSSVRLWGIGGEETYFTYYSTTVAKDVSKGDYVIEVVDLKNDKNIMSKLDANGKFIQTLYLNFDTDRFKLEYGAIYPVSADIENNLLIFNKPIPRDVAKGEKLYRRPTASPFNTGSYNKLIGDNQWHLYSANATINISEDRYDLNTRDIRFVTGVRTKDYFFLDDVKVGYATKVRLYRNNSKVYEGYESTFNDMSATDKAKPSQVSDITSTMEFTDKTTSTRKINISFKEAIDNGTTYNYQISSIDNNGLESPKSETNTQTVTSGIKGYSYVIDKNTSTIPDNTVDTTSTTIEKDITDTGVYYLHIKTIDNAGNASDVVHYKIDIPSITATANAKDNNIRLDWAMNDLTNKTFKIYQKKPGSNEFQSVSATDLSKSKQVRVLNIYPTATKIPTLPTFTTWDGETISDLPKSASLKQWMEQSNNENPKGYGKGLIEVTPISFAEFNSNSSSILKDSNGEWKYDVIVVGSWDNNGNEDTNAPNLFNSTATSNILSFVNNGKGLLVGHDVINNYVTKQWNMAFLPYINIDTLTSEATGDDEVYVNKKGLLVNYPWDITVKNILNIPVTHASRFFAKGDVWLKYVNPLGYSNTSNLKLVENENGTNNHYLTTWNNVAMIQTGHSNGEATPDEQKILANTIFYLNQLSTDNFLDDYSGQDITAPNKPVINSHSFTGDGFVNLNFNSVTDNGSEYSYYVESQSKDNDNLTLSNIVTETITSGIKGYSYVVDNNADTIPDDEIEQSTNETIKIKTNDNNELYVHIKAIDNAGNSSETYHYKIVDKTVPTISIAKNPSTWTNGKVTLTVKATDSESGIKYIILPNGEKVFSNTASYSVENNGIYYFRTVDYMGNETIISTIVDNIDKNKPTVTITNNENWTNKDVQVSITSTDD